jgi:hypothetical protein
MWIFKIKIRTRLFYFEIDVSHWFMFRIIDYSVICYPLFVKVHRWLMNTVFLEYNRLVKNRQETAVPGFGFRHRLRWSSDCRSFLQMNVNGKA